MDLYREQILDHYKHPRNFGHIEGADVSSEEINMSCGDRITIDIRFGSKDNERIVEEVKFSGEGCAIDQASASMLTEKITGMKTTEVMNLGLPDIEAMLGTTLTPSRVKCAVLPLEAIQKAIKSVR